MSIDETLALLWLRRIISVAVILQTSELFQVREAFGPRGIWRWTIVRDELIGFPRTLRWLFDRFLGDREFLFVLVLRLMGAVTALFYPHDVLFWFLLLSTVLIALRWRGTFNGGSDYMTIVVLMGACGGSKPWLAYVSIQLCLSYFVAGVVKLKSRNWRTGKALAGFLGASNYDVPKLLQKAGGRRGLSVTASWGLMAFECSFPLALVSREFCAVYIGLSLIFHLGNVYAFGLNRFLFAWAAGYPALYWLSGYWTQ
jgi:hypothetical protein